MISVSKTTNFIPNMQILAGITPADNSIEFVGNRTDKTVLWFQNGRSLPFCYLPAKYFELVKAEYISNPDAVAFLSEITERFDRQVELFTYYCYGGFDSIPDIANDKLSKYENFRDNRQCPSLLWNKKQLYIDDNPLTNKEIMITDMMSDDLPDKYIAHALNISHAYLDFLKRKLFAKAHVKTKVAYISKAIKQHII